MATSGVARRVVAARRRVHGDVAERAGREAEGAVLVPVFLGGAHVLVIEEEQVFALHVEDQRFGVARLGAEHARMEDAVQEERGVGGLRRDAGDAGDVDVRTAGAIEELEVRVERLAVAPEPDRQALVHPIEVEGEIALVPRRPAHGRARKRRHVDLGLHARREDLRGFDRLRRQHAVGDEEHVGVEVCAFVAGPYLRDDARDAHRLVAPGNVSLAHHYVVELEVLVGSERDPELERGRIVGADDATDGLRIGHVGDGTPGV